MRGFGSALLLLCAAPALVVAQTSAPDARAGIDSFNVAFDAATRRMDNAATVALWEEDGISLLPGTKPVVGRKAIGDLIDAVTKQFPGAAMEKFESACHDIEIAGPWASEWCTEHQIVRLSADKTFDGWGKMLLVLHRGTDGRWRLSREMWNQAVPADSGSASH
jgi:ketosteroid isomerase-like protein